jgi:hypothetical protein
MAVLFVLLRTSNFGEEGRQIIKYDRTATLERKLRHAVVQTWMISTAAVLVAAIPIEQKQFHVHPDGLLLHPYCSRDKSHGHHGKDSEGRRHPNRP